MINVVKRSDFVNDQTARPVVCYMKFILILCLTQLPNTQQEVSGRRNSNKN